MFGTVTEFRRARQLEGAALLLGAMGASWTLAGWIVGADYPSLLHAAMGTVLGAIILAVLGNWRSGLYFFLVWLLFEDLARKYLGNNMAIYFGKDVLIGATYLSFFLALRRGEERSFRPPFLLALAFFAGLGLCQVFNPNSPSYFYGLMGLKLYFYYIPLTFVGYALIRSKSDLDKFLLVSLMLAGLIAFLGVIQAIVGLNFLNPTSLAPEIATLGRYTRHTPITGVAVSRPSSVFVSDGRFASYLSMMWVIGIGAASYLMLRRHRRIRIVFGSIALVSTAIILSGSRGAFAYSVISSFVLVAGLLWGTPARWRLGGRVPKALTAGFGLAAIVLLLMVQFFPQELGARWALYAETLSPESPKTELFTRTWNYPIDEFLHAFAFPKWPLGYGIGTASLGGQYVARILGAPPTGVGVESGYGTILLELGPLGLLLWTAWTLVLVISGWRVVRRLRGSTVFPIGFEILWFVFLVLFPFTYSSLATYQNFVLNAYLWLSVGILYRLPELQEQDRPKTVAHGPTMGYGR